MQMPNGIVNRGYHHEPKMTSNREIVSRSILILFLICLKI